MNKPISRSTIHRSPILLGFRIIALELLIELVYLLINGVVNLYREQTNGMSEYSIVSPTTQFILLAFQTLVLLIILAKWNGETFELSNDELVIHEGVFSRSQKTYPYNNMQSVIVSQTFLERLINAGTVSVFIPTLGRDIVFREIPSPYQFAEKIKSAIPYAGKSQFLLRK